MLRTEVRAVPRGLIHPALHPQPAGMDHNLTGRDVFLSILHVSFKKLLLCLSQNKHPARARCWEFMELDPFSAAPRCYERYLSHSIHSFSRIWLISRPEPLPLMSWRLFDKRGSDTSLSWPWRHWWPFCSSPTSPVASLHPSPWPRSSISAQPGALGPCPRDIAGVPISSPVSWVDSCCHLISGPICCCFWLGCLDTLGPGLSLASYGAVGSPSYQQLALPTMSKPHGTASFGEGMACPGDTLSSQPPIRPGTTSLCRPNTLTFGFLF